MSGDRFAEAIRRIDEANGADPSTLMVDGVARPKELVHAEMMTRWVQTLRPEAGETLLLAARAHHIRRWEIPRDSFPEGRDAYLSWRTALHRFHAGALGEIMTGVGYESSDVKRAQDLVRKRGLGRDEEVQALEDGLCLVFIETQLGSLAERIDDDDRMVAVLASTWQKMSPIGRDAAKILALDGRAKRLFERATSEAAS